MSLPVSETAAIVGTEIADVLFFTISQPQGPAARASGCLGGSTGSGQAGCLRGKGSSAQGAEMPFPFILCVG